ncbi:MULTISPECIES: NAD-dependent epimerase/dehydratase family protein [unclassified Streptomyces]|uniref:NAD-dependent epimerase/dehydratase family protein n=1 Tax=unclassified Streptomyces TaxID=2593676 RepID=UPI00225A95BE|nr:MULTISPECIES: NAD-dependent epimerase/dehydratase family protein [unclassified Streptomyces]MCX4631622.1 NAD-dependent epimerase/dehydratase family protein [Streptomyces sp. NBC_01443]WSW47468.1 NAD-dependent epimerase/dehydratase family protein [Streptomyces sp. NBC_01001]
MQKILVIGGSRYFGKHLVTLLRDAGDEVTVLNRGSAAAPPGVRRLVADRDDAAQLLAALGARTFDTVVDQVCYTPLQAAVARRVFAGRTARYVMTSTMEVYDPAPPNLEARAYAEGKRQAEAVLQGAPETVGTEGVGPAPFGFAAVRTAHVLGGGREEFTGRLAHYVGRIAAGTPVDVHAAPYATSFIHHREIARFLQWAAGQSFTGVVDAASHGALDVLGLCELVADRVGRPARHRVVEQGAPASPFSFDRSYALDNSRAAGLGFGFGRVADWLPGAITEELAEAAR